MCCSAKVLSLKFDFNVAKMDKSTKSIKKTRVARINSRKPYPSLSFAQVMTGNKINSHLEASAMLLVFQAKFSASHQMYPLHMKPPSIQLQLVFKK